jgi:hypothetical protein
MNNILDRAKTHFKNQSVKMIEVPEWGENGVPLIIYSTPFTLAEKDRIYKGTQEQSLKVLVDCIILKAKDEKGDPLFTLEHKRDLLHSVSPEVIVRISNEMLAQVNLDDLIKN